VDLTELELPKEGRTSPTLHLLHLPWLMLLQSFSVPPLTMLVCCASWHNNNQILLQISELSITRRERLVMWTSLRLGPQCSQRQMNLCRADDWLRTMEHKFSMIRCSKTQKPLFAAQQLRGAAGAWCENFLTIQNPRHQITWTEFKDAFCAHYILEALMAMKAV